MNTQSVVAHNINERMQRNQHGGCAIMAMGQFLAEVVETGVDHYGLGRWCWMKVGSGTLLIATIESCTTLLPFPFEHGASLNQQSTYYSKLWRRCGSFYGQDLESGSNLMVGLTNSN